MLKAASITHINVPKYPELNVQIFYEYAKTKPELLAFLPDYKSTQKPEREYVFDIIGNVNPEFLNGKIEEAHKKRLSGEVVNDFEKIEIREDILEELISAKYESSKYCLY